MTLRGLREAAGLTQVEAAERAGLSQSHISQLELGKLQSPLVDTLECLATAYRTDLNTILAALRESVAA